MTVERCVSDVVLVDNALDESMLNPKLQIQNMQMSSDDQKKVQIERNCEITTSEAQKLQEITNEADDNRGESIDDKDKSEANITDGNLTQTINYEVKDVTDDIQYEEDIIGDEPKEAYTPVVERKKGTEGKPVAEIRKSQRIRKQRLVIHHDQIGDCDDKQDPDYR